MFYRIARRRSITVALAVAVLATLATAVAAEAQFLPAVLYGGGLKSGQKVEAFIGGISCGSTTASAKGEWVMQIPTDAACKPQAGNHITFKVDGADAIPSPVARWESGGIPTGSVATGYTLTTDGASGSGATDATVDGDEDGTNPAIFIVAGVALLAIVAGAGWFIYQRRRSA